MNAQSSIDSQAKPDVRGLAIGWGLSAVVSILAIIDWGCSFAWQFKGLSTYQIFPIFGLLAFSIMWSHYMMGLINRLVFPKAQLKSYFRWTGYLVLLFIVLHPGLLIYQRFRDGFGLPPGSYESYVMPSMAWITLLGSVCLLIFLAFELHRWFGKRSWWKYVVYTGDAAMVAIFYHGLQLGSQTHSGWYKTVWLFYGVSLILVLGYNYAGKIWHLPGTRAI